MKRTSLSVVLSLLPVLTLTACGGGSGGNSDGDEADSSGKTTISFFGWGSEEEQQNFQILINTFMDENPDIKVVYSATDSGTYMNTLKNKANSLPDVFYMPDYAFMQWADAGRLLPLDQYVSEEDCAKMWQLSTDMYRYDKDTTTLGEGTLYGLPKDLGPYPLVYNKDLLTSIIEENKLDLTLPDPNTPMTWESFRNYLKAITGTYGGKKVYGIGYYELMCAVYSNNADFFDEKVEKEGITDPNFIDAVQFIADLTLVDKSAPTADEQSSQNSFQRFLTEGCVFTFMGPWDCKQFWNDLKFEFDIVPPPVGPAVGAKSTSWVGSVAYCVSAKTPRKAAATRLATWLALSETSNHMNYQLGQAIPNNMQIAKSDYLQGVGLTGRQLMPENRGLFLDIVEGTPQIAGKNRARYYLYDNTAIDDLETSLSPVYLGTQTAEAFLKGYANKYQKALDDSNDYIK